MTRSPRTSASSIECVTKKSVTPVSATMRFSSAWRRCLVIASSAPNGSSISNICGSSASARAIATRCFIPPESSCGYRPAAAVRCVSSRKCRARTAASRRLRPFTRSG